MLSEMKHLWSISVDFQNRAEILRSGRERDEVDAPGRFSRAARQLSISETM